jgi:hypothetical protein
MQLLGPRPFVIFCATFALRPVIFPNRDHFHQGTAERALSSGDLSS